MAITITDYVNVSEQAIRLDLGYPKGLALLPRNFDAASDKSELLHESSVATVRSLLRQNKVEETRVEKEGDKIPSIQENEFALALPIIFVSGLLLSQNPHLLSIALNIISNYATDFFKGIVGRKKVVLDVVVEDKASNKCKRIHYEGDAEGLKEITQITGKVFTDGK